jgi:hypothetical protein
MQYHTFEMGRHGLAEALNDFAADGWRLVASEQIDDRPGVYLFIIERPRPAQNLDPNR